jgi:hypothetical protein
LKIETGCTFKPQNGKRTIRYILAQTVRHCKDS